MANEFWKFSLNIYSKQDIAEICLELQDEYDVDVNICLFLIWLAYNSKQMEALDFKRIFQKTREWHNEVIKPIRSSRMAVKKQIGVQPFYDLIKKCEMDAEFHQQESLFLLSQTLQTKKADFHQALSSHLRYYFSQLPKKMAEEKMVKYIEKVSLSI